MDAALQLKPFPAREIAVAALLGAGAAAVALSQNILVALAFCAIAIALPLLYWLAIHPSRWVLWFLLAAILLPPVPFPIGDSGFHVSIALAVFGLLFGVARLGEWRIELSLLNGVLALLFFSIVITLPFAFAYSGWIVGVGSTVRVVLLAVSLYIYVSASQGPDKAPSASTRRTVRILFFAAVAAALFGCIDFFYQLPAPAGFGPQFIWLDTVVLRRAQGLFYEASTLGNFCAFFLVMCAVGVLQPKQERVLPTPVLCGGAMVFAAALFLSYSRASLLNLAVSLLALAVLERRRLASVRAIALLTASGATLAAVLAAVFRDVLSGYIARLWLTVESFYEIPDRILSGRLESWKTVLTFLAGHPWHALFGIGYKTLPYTDFVSGRPVIADNMYLSMLAETGIVGLVALVLTNFAILFTCWRALRRKPGSFLATWLFCFWAGETVQMLSGDILTYWRVLPLYFWLLAQVARRWYPDANPAA